MGSVIVGVIGSLLGVLLGIYAQQRQANLARNWQVKDAERMHRLQQEDLLRDRKRLVYTEYLRSIDASYAQAKSGQKTRTEGTHILAAAAAEIELLSTQKVPNRLAIFRGKCSTHTQ